MTVCKPNKLRRPRVLGCVLMTMGWLVLAACVGPISNNIETETAKPVINPYMERPAMLVFSATAGWRHDSGIAGGDHFFAELANDRGWGLFTTVHPRVFNADDLARFEVVIFNNVTGDVLNRDQQQAFESWMDDGGAWIGLHGAGDGSMSNWPWYRDNLIGATFIGHTMGPQFQDADLVVLDVDHPTVNQLPDRWSHFDEWYSFDRVPDPARFTLLVGLDETSFAPVNNVVDRWPSDLSMGEKPALHPIAWARETDSYRAVYSAIGHDLSSYKDTHYRQLLINAFEWVTKSR